MAPGDDLAAAIAELARIPAPTFAEEARLAWVEERLSRLPGAAERDRAGNVVWRWGAGAPRLLVLAHVDTVFPAGTELGARRDGDALVGPGVGDNAAAVVVAIEVTGRLLREQALAPGAVAFTVGEEGLGNLRGAIAVCSELRPEAAIALEGHGLEHVLVDAVGSVRARVTVSGPGGTRGSTAERRARSMPCSPWEPSCSPARPGRRRSTSGSSRAAARSTRSPTPQSSSSSCARSSRRR